MNEDFHEQNRVWQRYIYFDQIGMKESFLILYNGWLVMDYILAGRTDEQHIDDFLTDDFLDF